MHRFARIQNVTDDRRQTDRQTDRQTTQCAKGATDSTVGQKFRGYFFCRTLYVHYYELPLTNYLLLIYCSL